MDKSDQADITQIGPYGSFLKIITLPQRLLTTVLSRFHVPIFLSLTISTLLYIFSAYLAALAETKLVWAGIVFYIASLVNQTCYHLLTTANKENITSKNIIKVIRYSAYTIFFSACGIAAYLESPSNIYLISVSFMTFIWVYLTLLLTGFVSNGDTQLRTILNRETVKQARNNSHLTWEVFLLHLYPAVRIEYLPLIVLAISVINIPAILFWISAVFLIGTIIVMLRMLNIQETEDAREIWQGALSFIFYLLGATLLLFLVLRLPFGDILEVINVVGPEIIWLLLFPVVWAFPYAMTLMVLLDNQISFRDALYTQVSGDGFNGITPFLGMGGEPFKAKHLSRFVPLAQSSKAIVQSRLIHALSGVLLTVVVLLICLLIIDLSSLPGVKLGMWLVTIIMTVVTALLIWLTMSKAPTHFTGFILTRFKLIEEFRHDPLTWSKLGLATFYRLLGRGGRFLELYLIFMVLDIIPKFVDVILVQGMVLATVSLFFFVPQGLGVNEAGIATALDIAGYSAAIGVVFGLIRRARIVVYTLLGLIVYAIGTYMYAGKKNKI